MRHVLYAICVGTLLAWACWATPVSACLWDRETGHKEREFRSQYQQDPPTPTAEPTPQYEDTWDWMFSSYQALFALGSLLTVSGLVLGLRRGRAHHDASV